MYDHILGEVTDVVAARVVLRAGGIGYELQVPTGVSADLRSGSEATLHTILHVTDGKPTLLGFASRSDRDFARMLLGVSGVGPAMSLAVLSTYTVAQIATALIASDHKMLQRVKGVGAKTAERLCLELRDKAGKLTIGGVTPGEAAVLTPQSAEDAMAALATLGYSEREARTKVTALQQSKPEASTEELIRLVLRG